MKITNKLLEREDFVQEYVLLNEKLYGREYIRKLWMDRIIYHPLVTSENLEKNLDRNDFRIHLYKLDKIDAVVNNGWLEAIGHLREYVTAETGVYQLYIKL